MEYKFRIIVLGDFGCGKTSLLERSTKDVYNSIYSSTIGVDYFNKKLNHEEIFTSDSILTDKCYNKSSDLDNKYKKYHTILKKTKKKDINYSLRIWDTSGQERFSRLINAYFKNLSGCILLFDITNRESFSSVERWHKELFESLDDSIKVSFPFIMVGNKLDLFSSRSVSYKEANNLAKKLECEYIECSVKNNINIHLIFKELITDLLIKVNTREIVPDKKNGIHIYAEGEELNFSNVLEDDIKLSNNKFKCCNIL